LRLEKIVKKIHSLKCYQPFPQIHDYSVASSIHVLYANLIFMTIREEELVRPQLSLNI